MISGFTAGGIATTIFQPFEVIKTRQQLTSNNQQRSILSTTITIYYDNGYIGLYRGLIPRVIRRSCSNALSWMLFEQIVTFYRGVTGL